VFGFCLFFWRKCTKWMLWIYKKVVKKCWRKAASHVVPLLRIGWFLLLRTPQQRLSKHFNGPDNLKIVLFRGGSGYHVRHGSLGPHESAPTASQSVQPFLHSTSTWPTHKHTDHATCDICRNRPHLCYACNAA